jgi:C-terminal processing protease CtpA/Prc
MLLELSIAILLQSSAGPMAATMLSGAVCETRNTIGIVGYREALFSNRIVEIHPGSPIEGILQKGDRVLAVDGNRNCHQTCGQPGSEITLTVSRGGTVFDVTVRRIAVQDLHIQYLNHIFGVRD